eukprot:TRINITY_DN8508_c0_g1_i1.p1 TRINITY_DN8508_c0_g1~~TRINITY_DN8508_c0_g1_i1.p1  ORF type:complete len:255 (+),score=65.51 TRINITY_DN8508_c0_g1_i1:39-803(+)
MSDKKQIIKMKKGKTTYELLVNHGSVDKWKEDGKKEEDWRKVLYVDDLFKNSSKGERPTKEELAESFGNFDLKTIQQTIAFSGEIQLTTNDRKELTDNKRKAIINIINKNYVDPQSKRPYSVVQIDSALTSIKAKIDIQKSAEDQVKLIMKDLVLKLPLTKVAAFEGKLIISNSHVGKVQSNLKSFCSVGSESWSDNSWIVKVSLTTSEYDPLIQFLTKSTNGDFQFESDMNSPSPSTNSKHGKNNTNKKNNKK